MSKKKKETVGQIIARAPEDTAQLGRYDPDVFAHLEGLISELRHGQAPSPEDYEVLADIVEAYTLLKTPGRLPKSPEAKADKTAQEAAAFQWGRERRDRKIADGVERAKASRETVAELKQRYPFLARLADATVRFRLHRR
jgi:hypothetical protein